MEFNCGIQLCRLVWDTNENVFLLCSKQKRKIEKKKQIVTKTYFLPIIFSTSIFIFHKWDVILHGILSLLASFSLKTLSFIVWYLWFLGMKYVFLSYISFHKLFKCLNVVMGRHKKHAYLLKKLFIKLESHKIMLIELKKYLKHRIMIYNTCISLQNWMQTIVN